MDSQNLQKLKEQLLDPNVDPTELQKSGVPVVAGLVLLLREVVGMLAEVHVALDTDWTKWSDRVDTQLKDIGEKVGTRAESREVRNVERVLGDLNRSLAATRGEVGQLRSALGVGEQDPARTTQLSTIEPRLTAIEEALGKLTGIEESVEQVGQTLLALNGRLDRERRDAAQNGRPSRPLARAIRAGAVGTVALALVVGAMLLLRPAGKAEQLDSDLVVDRVDEGVEAIDRLSARHEELAESLTRLENQVKDTVQCGHYDCPQKALQSDGTWKHSDCRWVVDPADCAPTAP